MRIVLFLIVISLGVGIYGCSKGPPPIYHYVSNWIKKDFSFKPGTYWIMKDSISGRIDSFFVTNNKDELTETEQGGNDYPAQYIENVRIDVSEYNTDISNVADSIDWAYNFAGASAGLKYRALRCYPFYSYSTGTIIYSDLFDYPRADSFSLSTYYQPNEDTGIVNQRLSTFQINSLSFSKVAVINHYYTSSWRDSTGNLTYFRYNDLFYVCPKIGLVKMRLDHHDTVDRVWEIQRWNIIL